MLAKTSKGKALLTTLFFIIGVTASFLTYGVLAAYSGELLNSLIISNLSSIAISLGLFLISIGIFMISPLRVLFSLIPSAHLRFKRSSPLNALLLGFTFSLVAAPCAATILVAAFLTFWLQSLGSTTSFVLTALSYSLGVNTPFFTLGILTQLLGKSIEAKFTRSILVKYNEVISGLTIIVLGVLTIISVNGYDLILTKVSRDLIPYFSILSFIGGLVYSIEATKLGVKIGVLQPLLLGVGLLLIGTTDLVSSFPLVLSSPEIIFVVYLAGRLIVSLGGILLITSPLASVFPVIPIAAPDAFMLLAWLLGPGRREKEHLFASLYLIAHLLVGILQHTSLFEPIYPYVIVVLPTAYLSLLLPALKFSKILTSLRLLEEL
ncbi:MAG: cytochrome c biogenesis protein CcdA [Infirmifilum sp.]